MYFPSSVSYLGFDITSLLFHEASNGAAENSANTVTKYGIRN